MTDKDKTSRHRKDIQTGTQRTGRHRKDMTDEDTTGMQKGHDGQEQTSRHRKDIEGTRRTRKRRKDMTDKDTTSRHNKGMDLTDSGTYEQSPI